MRAEGLTLSTTIVCMYAAQEVPCTQRLVKHTPIERACMLTHGQQQKAHLWLLPKLRVDDCKQCLKSIARLFGLGAVHADIVSIHHTETLGMSAALAGG